MNNGRPGLLPHSKFLDYAEIVGDEYKRLKLDGGQRQLKDRLEILLQKRDNQACADCGRLGPRWANTNLGLFFCIDCSHVHRNLGTRKVEKSQNLIKSVHRDVWTASQVEVQSLSYSII
jgi:ribosomal protein L37AE/L43A